MYRYAYFKKLTYFSTECIYSPDGESRPVEIPPAFSSSRSSCADAFPLRLALVSFLVTAPTLIAYRGHARVFLKDLEAIRPSAIVDIIHSGETFELGKEVRGGMKGMRESESESSPSRRSSWARVNNKADHVDGISIAFAGGVGDVYRELSEVRVYKLERPLREFLLEVVVRGCDVYGGRKADPTDLDVPL